MRLTIVLLALAMTLVATPFAAADETDPDCEADQPLIGYRSTEFLIATVEGAGLYACEGEHWDGQDTVQPDQSPGCSPTTSLVPTDLFIGTCVGPDPNTAPSDDALNPVGLRISSVSSTDGSNVEVYTFANIALVGRAGVYVSDDSTAVYVRDNTPGNLLATVVSLPRITQGYVSENDCSQAIYQHGAYNPPSQCGRDNTAITLEYGNAVGSSLALLP